MPELLITSASGLEAVVARELQSLGYESQILQSGRQLIQAEPRDIAVTNLHLRVAERVLVRVGCYRATDFEALFDQAVALPWEQWIPIDGRFPVRGRSIKSQLASVPALQRAINRAVAQRLMSAHSVSTLPETGPLYSIEVALLKNEVTLTIDTTGVGLHKRGYRPAAGKAPLRETLAAALVLLSRWTPDRPLIDPFCGLGTIPIEAALLGRAIAPGCQRQFAAEEWPLFKTSGIWETVRAEAAAQVIPELPQRILGSDIDGRALHWARQHAAQAGVGEDVHFQLQPFDQLSSSRKFGSVITNPPYGQRIGGPDEMAALYQSIPLVLRRLPTWSHFILTAYEGFERIVGREATRRRKLYNGRIECQYYQFHGPLPDKSASAPPIFGGLAPAAKRQADEFRNRLQKRARHLRRWPARGITCYRLYERDIPEVPLVVDRYEDWLHISEFDRPHDRSPASHADWLDLMKRTAAESLGVPLNQVVMKQRQRQRGEQQYQRLAETADHLIAHEGGLQFSINLKDYLDTGLFLDHRKTRSMVRELASATRFLNLFAYTGSFSVYAANGGARETVSVDASRAYLDWAGENFRLNDMPLDHHRFVCADVLDYLRDLPPDQKFDLVVADPPTFSNSKTRATDWDVQKHHVPLLQAIRSHLAPDATLFFSTNFRRFKLDPAATEGLSVHEISKQTVPDDFRNRRIHRCWKMRPEGAPRANPSL